MPQKHSEEPFWNYNQLLGKLNKMPSLQVAFAASLLRITAQVKSMHNGCWACMLRDSAFQ